VRRGVPSLRSERFAAAFRSSLRQACERSEFRVVHYSLQRDHVHLVVESAGKAALGRGMKAVGARIARAVQRTFGWRGPVLDGRYHLRVLRTPREVRNVLAYVLLNARRHCQKRRGAAPPVRIDAASSAGSTGGVRGRPTRSSGRTGRRRSRARGPGSSRAGGAATGSSTRPRSPGG
jgi:REP element-mobilizing transposase RayT